MKLKNEVIFNNAFAKAFSRLIKLPFKATIAIQLLQTFSELSKQQENLFKVRDNMISQYGVINEQGKPEFIEIDNSKTLKFKDPESEISFIKEMDELLQLEFEIPLKEKLKLDEKIQISGEEILILLPVIDVKI